LRALIHDESAIDNASAAVSWSHVLMV
jgi:hypothetical protein